MSAKANLKRLPLAPPKRLTGADLSMGQYGVTEGGYIVVRSENRLVYLEDGSSSSGNLIHGILEILSPGDVVELTIKS